MNFEHTDHTDRFCAALADAEWVYANGALRKELRPLLDTLAKLASDESVGDMLCENHDLAARYAILSDAPERGF